MARPLHGQTYVWLHVFSCAARHLSFTRCAEELHITPGGGEPTNPPVGGASWVSAVPSTGPGCGVECGGSGWRLRSGEAYGSIDAELQRLDAGMIERHLAPTLDPVVSRQVAHPNVRHACSNAFPDIQLRMVAEDSSIALHEGDFDLAIDLNDGSYPGLLSTALLDEQIFPVCAPSLLRGRPPLHGPADLVHFPLLHDITAWRGSYEYAEWEFYLNAIGYHDADVRRGHTFNRNHLTIEAAIAGMGVAIARRTLLNDELAARHLDRAVWPRGAATTSAMCCCMRRAH